MITSRRSNLLFPHYHFCYEVYVNDVLGLRGAAGGEVLKLRVVLFFIYCLNFGCTRSSAWNWGSRLCRLV